MRKICVLLIIILAGFMGFCILKEDREDISHVEAMRKCVEVISRPFKKTKAMDDVLYIQNRINTFQRQEARYPYSLNELIEKKYLEKLPEPPKGMNFHYDSSSGNVSLK